MNNVMIGAVKKAAKKQPNQVFKVYTVVGISETDGLPIWRYYKTMSIRRKDMYDAKKSLLNQLRKKDPDKYWDAELMDTIYDS